MKSMTSYNTWDIVLVPFPFTNLRTTKRRPALIISPDKYNMGPDIVILFITSNVSTFGRTGDHIIKKWKESGLPKPSMTRMKFATIEQSIIIKKIGNLHKSDRDTINKKFVNFFDFRETG